MMGQGGATLQDIQEQRWGVSWGVKQRCSGVGGVVCCSKKGETGSPQRGRAVHGTRVVLCQPPLR